jgi:hypothetical protein
VQCPGTIFGRTWDLKGPAILTWVPELRLLFACSLERLLTGILDAEVLETAASRKSAAQMGRLPVEAARFSFGGSATRNRQAELGVVADEGLNG